MLPENSGSPGLWYPDFDLCGALCLVARWKARGACGRWTRIARPVRSWARQFRAGMDGARSGRRVEGGGSLGILFALGSVLVPLLVDQGEPPALTAKALWRGLVSGMRAGFVTG